MIPPSWNKTLAFVSPSQRHMTRHILRETYDKTHFEATFWGKVILHSFPKMWDIWQDTFWGETHFLHSFPKMCLVICLFSCNFFHVSLFMRETRPLHLFPPPQKCGPWRCSSLHVRALGCEISPPPPPPPFYRKFLEKTLYVTNSNKKKRLISTCQGSRLRDFPALPFLQKKHMF